ncbi:MAG TPA: hypothetical protein VIG97_03300 [Luteimonas sp.]
MACECLDTIDSKLAEAGANTKVKRAFFLGSEISMTVAIGSELTEKKRGAKAWALKPTFCPFCGLHYGTGEPATPGVES